jgi:hypothetical protein
MPRFIPILNLKQGQVEVCAFLHKTQAEGPQYCASAVQTAAVLTAALVRNKWLPYFGAQAETHATGHLQAASCAPVGALLNIQANKVLQSHPISQVQCAMPNINAAQQTATVTDGLSAGHKNSRQLAADASIAVTQHPLPTASAADHPHWAAPAQHQWTVSNTTSPTPGTSSLWCA